MKVREGFVEVEGHRLACLAVNEHLARADEPAVVFVHGVLASIHGWWDAVPADFRDNRAWYALSLPGHYPSTVPADFNAGQVDEAWFYRVMEGALVQWLGGRQAVLVGHSTGGFAALNLAIHQSPQVAGVVSVAGFHRGHWGGVEGRLLTLASYGRWARPLFALNLAVARRSKWVQRIFASLLAHDSRAFLRSPGGRSFIRNIRPDIERQDAAALFYLFNGISKVEIGHRLGEIRVPCHIFAGTHDPVVPAAQSLLIAATVPHARTEVFRDVGHMPFVERAEQYFSALERAITDITQHSHRAANAA